MEDQSPLERDEDGQPVGLHVLSWEIDEYPRHVRTRTWYVLGGLAAAALLAYALATANFLFAVIILMGAIITVLSSFTEPDRIPVIITTNGVVVGEHFYDFRSIRHFSLVYNPPEAKWLYIGLGSVLHPYISIPLEETDPNEVRQSLLPYCVENLEQTEETLTDVLRRVYKL